MGKIKVEWNIETGYVMRIPNYAFDIDEDDLRDMADASDSEMDFECKINEYIRDEFEQRITYYTANMDKLRNIYLDVKGESEPLDEEEDD